jgi:hypothetical protein
VGELTLACQPITGLGRPGRSWPPSGPPWAGGNQARTRPGPEGRLSGQDPRIEGQTLVRLIERESSDAAAKGIEQCRRASPLAEELDQLCVGSGTWPCFTVEKEAQQEPARYNATSESEHSVRLGSLKGSSARALRKQGQEKEAQQEPARSNATSESEHRVRL